MPKRILILSASVGAGHIRAAEAVEVALRQIDPDAQVQNLDVMEMTNRLFRRLYARSYIDLVNKAPHVLGYFYDMLDQPSKSGKNRSDKLRLLFQKLNLTKFQRLLKTQRWDLVINTHFLPAEIVASLRKKEKLSVPQVTVTTDFVTHRLWVNQPTERYFTATEEGAIYLQHWGVSKADIEVTGIPIHPRFSTKKDRSALLAQHGLANKRPIVLQLCGGFGVGPAEKLFEALLTIEKPIQIVFIAGRNEQLKEKLAKKSLPSHHSAKVLGYTTEIDDWMALADLIVSKPGGLTTSETLASGAVMVIVNPIPGQESRNSDFLLENGAAIKVNHSAVLAYKISELLENPERMNWLKSNVQRLGRARAAFDVVEKSLQLIDSNTPNL